MKYTVRIMMVMGLALLLDACGPSSWITSSWKAQEAVPREYKKIVVVGLIRENDRSLREKMEQHLVGDLKDLGYEAICSCEEYSPKAFENMGEEKVIEKLRDSGADAVLTVVLLDKSRERYYVPGRIYYSPYAVYHHRFYGYYHTMYTRVYSPGYYVDDTKYFWESNLYDLRTQQLVYSAQSRSFDPSTTESLGHEYGQMIVNDLVKNKVLQDQQGPGLKAM